MFLRYIYTGILVMSLDDTVYEEQIHVAECIMINRNTKYKKEANKTDNHAAQKPLLASVPSRGTTAEAGTPYSLPNAWASDEADAGVATQQRHRCMVDVTEPIT
jgi:hypothetical protein